MIEVLYGLVISGFIIFGIFNTLGSSSVIEKEI